MLRDETVTASAKAIQEVARTTSKAVEAGEKFGGFIARFISGSLEQAIGIFEDKLKYMRWERQVALMKKAELFMAEQGIQAPTRVIPLKLAVPLFQAASLEDDDYLQDQWARLLVNAANAASPIEVNRSHIDILERLSPLEAHLLNRIYALSFSAMQHDGVATEKLPSEANIASSDSAKESKEPNEQVKLALANLARLGCLVISKSVGGGERFERITPTLLGKNFVDACTLPTTTIQ